MLKIFAESGAPLEANCYLAADVEAGEAIVIDAPWQVERQMQAKAAEWGVTVRLIVCTHGHWDHTMGLPELMAAFDAPTACHVLDADMLEHPSFAPFSFPFTLTPVTPDRLLEEGDIIEVGSHQLAMLHTPGHTPGCICLYEEAGHTLFTGDTLFAGAYGRVDLPGGNPGQMEQSLLRLRALPPETHLYPGHGPDTLLGDEHWLLQAKEFRFW